LFKNLYISVAKPKNTVVFALTNMSEILAVLGGDFGMNSVDCDEAMKRGDETLNAASLHFLKVILPLLLVVELLLMEELSTVLTLCDNANM
jgi:hypothetical protein